MKIDSSELLFRITCTLVIICVTLICTGVTGFLYMLNIPSCNILIQVYLYILRTVITAILVVVYCFSCLWIKEIWED